jgi:Fe-S-cluster-containing dehydrogenase component/anaerobic selenocysteine-containing dehydrogenase
MSKTEMNSEGKKMENQNDTLKTWRDVSDIESQEPKDKDIREFPESVQELIDRGGPSAIDRKSFLTLMGASVSMATMGCMKEPVEKILPYLDRPNGHLPGIAEYYATVRISPTGFNPMLVKVREGKPIFIEPLTAHPRFQGALSADTLATIWDLYDPDRVKNPMKGTDEISWEKMSGELKGIIEEETVIISRANFSPSEKAAFADFAGNKRIFYYDPLHYFSEKSIGDKKSGGSGNLPDYRFDQADLIISIDGDFLGSWPFAEVYTKQFVSNRYPESGSMNRLITIESNLSLTGSNADSRHVINSGSSSIFALGLARELGGDSALGGAASGYTPEKVEAITGLKASSLKQVAKEIKANQGKVLIVMGGLVANTGESGVVQQLENGLNKLAGGSPLGSSVTLPKYNSLSDFDQLIGDINSGKTKTVILDQCNPVFDLPQLKGLKEALKKVNTISITSHRDESASLAKFILPVAHYLEGWSDALGFGSYSVSQPVIKSFYDVKSAGDIWHFLSGNTSTFFDRVRSTASNYGAASQKAFDSLLSKGFTSASIGGSSGNSASKLLVKEPKKGSYSLTLYNNLQIQDGAGANIAFRQELPDPISKVCWENYLAVSPTEAKEQGWKSGSLVKVSATGQSVTLPVYIQPGIKRKSVYIAVGYGHDGMGEVANGKGVNAFALISGVQSAGIPAEVESLKEETRIATTQRHGDLGIERGLVRMATLSDFKKDSKVGHEFEEIPYKGKAVGMYADSKYPRERWSMNIDMSRCTGCSACVVACYSENNIPAVGKDEVWRGREMSWLRIDRYYGYTNDEQQEADPDMENPEVLFQPLLCQHCDNAPCENVCPVGATGHSTDGINYMSYNRCIGTRYCANNCPFKVRRFNWFENWENKLRDPQQFALNPEVTVRSRGVIEKCSFCQQRIAEARQKATVEGRSWKGEDVKVACQSVCASDAITFGNENDQESPIYKANNMSRSYVILPQINVKPAVHYQVKIKNRPNGSNA